MSLQMITTFMQPNGSVPKSAFTVVDKPNNDIEIVTESQDKAINASLEHVNTLIDLHRRISADGLSRATVAELKEVAPAAVPGGYGLEAFTEMPSNVMMKEGLEGITDQVLSALWKMIKFLIEKLKAGFNILVDSYKVLTGISPSAYKLAKQQAITEVMIKNWRSIMQSDLDEVVLAELEKGTYDSAGIQLILDGFWNDAGGICTSLGDFEQIISNLQRAVEEMLYESTKNQIAYNRMAATVAAGKSSPEEVRDFAARTAVMLESPAFQRISGLMEQLAKKVVSSDLYKAEDKKGKSILDRLRSDKFRDILVGLREACETPKPLCLKPSEAYSLSRQQNLDAVVEQLKQFDPVNMKAGKDLKQQLDALRAYDRYVPSDMSDEQGFEVVTTKFLEQQNDVKAVMDVVRTITANYAETVFKVTAFRNRLRTVVVPKIVAATPDEVAMEANEAYMDEIRKVIKQWITNVTKL